MIVRREAYLLLITVFLHCKTHHKTSRRRLNDRERAFESIDTYDLFTLNKNNTYICIILNILCKKKFCFLVEKYIFG